MKTTDKAGGDRRIAVGLVLVGITSVQFGSALATPSAPVGPVYDGPGEEPANNRDHPAQSRDRSR